MIRSIETTGKTKELAIRAALEQLKLTEDDITYEILELGRSGFLGIGAVPARVRVSYDDGQSEPKPVKTQPVKAPAKKPETAQKSEPKKAEPRQYAAGSQEKEVESSSAVCSSAWAWNAPSTFPNAKAAGWKSSSTAPIWAP